MYLCDIQTISSCANSRRRMSDEISPRGTLLLRGTKTLGDPSRSAAQRTATRDPRAAAPSHLALNLPSLSSQVRDVSHHPRAGTRAPRSSPVVVSRFRDHARDRFSERPLDPRERSRDVLRDIRRRHKRLRSPSPRVEEEASPARIRARRPPRGAPALGASASQPRFPTVSAARRVARHRRPRRLPSSQLRPTSAEASTPTPSVAS